MKVLITGGCGFIGSHTTDRLIEDGHEVRILDKLTKPVHQDDIPSYMNKECEIIIGDVNDRDILLNCLKDIDIVYHFAAFQDYLPNFSEFIDVNVSSTGLIYELILEHNLPIKKVIIASSQAVLGEGLYSDMEGGRFSPSMRSEENLRNGNFEHGEDYRWLVTPENQTNPQNPYGMSKLFEETYGLNLGKRYDIPTVALRYSIVQGSRQSFYNAYSGACRIFCLSFHQGIEPTIYEDGKQVRDFVNIHDVVDANIKVLYDSRADYEVFNVGSGNAITVIDFAKIVAEIYNYQNYNPTPCGKYRFGDTRHICSDITKLKSLGWEPSRTVKDSVIEYKSWLDNAENVDSIIEYCNKKMKELNVVRSINA